MFLVWIWFLGIFPTDFALSVFQPITFALVYVGTTLKDLSDVKHGWSEFSTARWVRLSYSAVHRKFLLSHSWA